MPESGPGCLICAKFAGPVCLLCTDFAGTDCLISAEFARQLQRSRVIRVSTLRPLLLKVHSTSALMMDTVFHVPPPTWFSLWAIEDIHLDTCQWRRSNGLSEADRNRLVDLAMGLATVHVDAVPMPLFEALPQTVLVACIGTLNDASNNTARQEAIKRIVETVNNDWPTEGGVYAGSDHTRTPQAPKFTTADAHRLLFKYKVIDRPFICYMRARPSGDAVRQRDTQGPSASSGAPTGTPVCAHRPLTSPVADRIVSEARGF